MKKSVLFALALVFAALGIISCGKDSGGDQPSPDASVDRKALLTQWADSLVKPGYQRLNDKLVTLKAKTSAFTAAPTAATLVAARQAWQAAYVEWQKVELYEFGPAEQVSLRNHFNIYPADAAGINSNITRGTYNFELATAIPQQGFPALDYLLNGIAANDAAIAQQYATSANHRRYLTDVVAKMEQTFGTVYTQWNGSYRETFINNTGTDASSSLSRVINAYSQYFERYLRAGKVGIPAGTMSGTPNPEKMEAYYLSGALPLQLATTAHTAVQQFFNGRAGQPSLKSYLDAVGAKDSRTGQSLSSFISTQFGVSYQRLSSLGPDLYTTLTARNTDAVASYNEMQKAVRMIKVDMTSALGITVTYVDNDGD
ncbi:imelysin family protein [Hymenobacter taeanensis]|uniref:Imelysin family protein n=1 Tax=Hymenobacter taeanensis TaxID=2735321 RepID=A0A6M6BHQ7_9BACT|nr:MULTISPECIES: imelysin family protein [Hymenobacter]QJX47579.1 imelysin family protein [Hymenobacter taeanensis]UOQ82938.1 imelysin family protein [Hymenobacter sp. 5414T-23]